MSQARPAPVRNTLGRISVQRVAMVSIGLLGAGQRTDEIVLGTKPDRPTYTSHDAIDFPIRTIAIKIQNRQARRLRKQFFVGQVTLPQLKARGQHCIIFPVEKLNRSRAASCPVMKQMPAIVAVTTYRTFRSTHSSQITPAAEIAAKISNNHQYQFIANPHGVAA